MKFNSVSLQSPRIGYVKHNNQVHKSFKASIDDDSFSVNSNKQHKHRFLPVIEAFLNYIGLNSAAEMVVMMAETYTTRKELKQHLQLAQQELDNVEGALKNTLDSLKENDYHISVLRRKIKEEEQHLKDVCDDERDAEATERHIALINKRISEKESLNNEIYLPSKLKYERDRDRWRKEIIDIEEKMMQV